MLSLISNSHIGLLLLLRVVQSLSGHSFTSHDIPALVGPSNEGLLSFSLISISPLISSLLNLYVNVILIIFIKIIQVQLQFSNSGVLNLKTEMPFFFMYFFQDYAYCFHVFQLLCTINNCVSGFELFKKRGSKGSFTEVGSYVSYDSIIFKQVLKFLFFYYYFFCFEILRIQGLIETLKCDFLFFCMSVWAIC